MVRSGVVVTKNNQKKIIFKFRQYDVTTEDRAKDIRDIGVMDCQVFNKMVKLGLIMEATEGKYYLVEENIESFLKKQKKLIVAVVIPIAIIAIITIVFVLLKP